MKTELKTTNYNLEQLQKAYQADQQVKYMSLEAELELLLQQIKTAKK
ncbi:hypothetical protein VKI21_09075 [Cyanobacterium aponinum UTEX 3222]|uniref:Uncharacterized protein n=2 Tax=Cyanobacterium aponinum TaxID=379064 RepID=K9Z6P3_CYAAP|nr:MULTISPECIES: hypothetical protein [Cyanobacterium]WRL43822.1 hypothetical protein VKI21_09075 [Cyanobacterium aponinum UTEX 3222]AFZ54220.1 hypothetical protein Cyan10605_2132 [Cyanobacterium aponinum PCC 10605]MBD2393827.1 hypothetical protein [Cyanobacterium aponinum FACHB-4101]WPF89115.1 hypothetical protein SAY89_02225 [Cyanobacterium aponinum AL20115]WRL37462.1 hypothetical protein VKI22_12600 [Cyanobacterium aponinum UTEX 3221]